MKFIHTSDWHLGRMLYGHPLLPDQEHFLSQNFFPLIEREQPDAVLLSGDIYDRSVAPAAAIRLFDYTVNRLAEMGVPLLSISGNHDGADRLAVGAPLLRKSGVVIAATPQSCLEPYVLEKDGETVQVFTMPWMDVHIARAFLGESPDGDRLRTSHQCAEQLIARMQQQFLPGACHLLLAHCFVAGSALSDSENPIFVGGSDEVHSEAFAPFDYVALGHLHAPQRAGKNARYSGSPLWYSVDEEHHRKSITIVETGANGISIREEAVVPQRRVRRLSGKFRELLQQGKESPSLDLVDITLTDDGPVFLPAKQLRPYYPNLLSIHSQWMMRRQEETPFEAADARNTSRTQVLTRFLEDVCDTQLTEEDQSLFEETLRELHLREGGKAL